MIQHQSKFRGFAMVRFTGIGLACMVLYLALTSCIHVDPPPPATRSYPSLPLAHVPEFMRGTIYERVIVTRVSPSRTGGYGLVVNLHGTGGTSVNSQIRQYIKKKIDLSKLDADPDTLFRTMSADEILDNKGVTIVQLMGMIPPGARQGQRIDVIVQALPRSGCTSLAGGRLYQAELSEKGLEIPLAANINAQVAVQAGDVFVNPVLAYSKPSITDTAAMASLTTGFVLNAGLVMKDRPIFMQMREPSGSEVRAIEQLIMRRFPYLSPGVNTHVASPVRAENEDLLALYTPDQFVGDWQHYLGVVEHLYLQSDNPVFAVAKCKELNIAAHQPDAPLMDISYCWEALGPEKVSLYDQLITDPKPEIAFAAARAAAFNGDAAAKQALLQMARDANGSFQLAAVQTLATMPVTPETTQLLRSLLDSPAATVRESAFTVLSRKDGLLFSKIITRKDHKFVLDIIEGNSPPLIYATRTGVPHIAVFGHDVQLRSPVFFVALDDRFSISYIPESDLVNIAYRDIRTNHTHKVKSHNNLAEIVARLGGEGPDADSTFDFNYTDILVLLQQMDERHLLVSKPLDPHAVTQFIDGAFVLEKTIKPTSVLAGVGNDTTISGTSSESGRPNGGPATKPVTSDNE